MVDGARAETRSCQQMSPMEIWFGHTEERGEACVKEAVRGTTRGSPTLWHYSSIF
ncbi:hypothetical protein ERO13_A11G191600v2 [Gossypium hirsutum]|nr:hypothetical protein ERO13_A11G191600v2 [Gossypium hirsutum]